MVAIPILWRRRPWRHCPGHGWRLRVDRDACGRWDSSGDHVSPTKNRLAAGCGCYAESHATPPQRHKLAIWWHRGAIGVYVSDDVMRPTGCSPPNWFESDVERQNSEEETPPNVPYRLVRSPVATQLEPIGVAAVLMSPMLATWGSEPPQAIAPSAQSSSTQQTVRPPLPSPTPSRSASCTSCPAPYPSANPQCFGANRSPSDTSTPAAATTLRNIS